MPPGQRMAGGHLDRLGHVLALKHVEPQQRPAGVQDRALGDLELAVAYPDRSGLCFRREFTPGNPCASGVHRDHPLSYLAAYRVRWAFHRHAIPAYQHQVHHCDQPPRLADGQRPPRCGPSN
jgi:hypothetical protein